MNRELKDLLVRVIYRFLRGGVATAIGAMILIVPQNIDSFGEITGWLNALYVAGAIGFISGGLLALDKMLRDTTQYKK